MDDPNTPEFNRVVLSFMERSSAATQTHIARVEQLITDSVHTNAQAIADLRTELRSDIAQALTTEDPCEVRIGGIPSTITLADTDIAKAVLRTIKLDHLIPQIVLTRPWTPAGRTGDAQRSFVIQFSGPVVRNQIIKSSIRLRDQLVSDTILGLGGSAKIHVSTILPPHNFAMWRAAMNCYELYGYARPVKRGINVFMRKSAESPLIPILSLQDLQSLAPLNPPCETSMEVQSNSSQTPSTS